MKRKPKILLIIGFSLFFLSLILILSSDSFYSKETIGRIILNTIRYEAANQLALVKEAVTQEKTFTLDVPFHKQTYPITCEVASLRMVLNYYGHNLNEDELIANLNFSTKEPMTSNRIWGDPDEGFVGDIRGSVFNGTGYGVYDFPIRELAKQYQGIVVLNEPDINKIIGLLVGGKPVIAWGLLSRTEPIYWQTVKGKTVEAYRGEHARVVIGFTGERHNPKQVILLDPIYGKIHMDKDDFVEEWETMHNRHVVVY